MGITNPSSINVLIPRAGGASTANVRANFAEIKQQFLNVIADFDGKQNIDATLTALAALSTTADKLIYSTGGDTFALTSLTSFIRGLLGNTDATAARETLELLSMAIQAADAVNISGGSIAGLDSLGVSGNISVTGTVDGRDVSSDGSDLDILKGKVVYTGIAGGTADALTSSLNPTLASLADESIISLRALLPNTTATPTLAADGLAAWTIVKNGSQPLLAGDIAGADHELLLKINTTNAEYELLNPAIANSSITEAKLNFTVVFTESFTSAEQTITTAGGLVIAHGLGAEPSLIQPFLICKTAEHGYSIGDKILNTFSINSSAATDRISSLIFDATNLTIRYSNQTVVFSVGNKDTGAAASLTNANWKLIVRAWA